jgi:F-type H+-transporting ATPase subunit delta
MRTNTRLARLYARALHEGSGGRVELVPLKPHLEAAGERLAQPGLSFEEYLALLGNPDAPEIRRLLAILFRRKRRRLIGEIIEAYAIVCEEKLGIRRARMTVARELAPPQRARIEALLAVRLKAPEVRLELEVDPALIGGAIVRIGDTLIDGSLRGTLDRFRNKFVSE